MLSDFPQSAPHCRNEDSKHNMHVNKSFISTYYFAKLQKTIKIMCINVQEKLTFNI